MITDNTRQGGHLHVDLSTSFERILFSHIKDRSASKKGVGQPPGNAGAIVVDEPGLDTQGSSDQDMPSG